MDNKKFEKKMDFKAINILVDEIIDGKYNCENYELVENPITKYKNNQKLQINNNFDDDDGDLADGLCLIVSCGSADGPPVGKGLQR